MKNIARIFILLTAVVALTACNKETLVLNAFLEFSRMMKDPEEYVKRIESGKGNDRL